MSVPTRTTTPSTMAPPPITEITIKVKKHRKSKSHNHAIKQKEVEQLKAIPEHEELRRPQGPQHQRSTTATPSQTNFSQAAEPPLSKARRSPEELESHLASLRRKIMDRSEISSLTSRSSFYDDPNASFNPSNKPRDIFRARTPLTARSVKKASTNSKPVVVGTPQLPVTAGNDSTPRRHNRSAAAPPANIASTMAVTAPSVVPKDSRTRTPTTARSVKKASTNKKPVVVGTPQRPTTAGTESTPRRHNHKAAAMPTNVASTVAVTASPVVSKDAPLPTYRTTPYDTPSLLPSDNYSVQTYSTAGTTSILGTMTKLAVQNILDDVLFEDDMDNYSLSAVETSEIDSYFGANETVQEDSSRLEGLKQDVLARDNAMTISRVQTKKNDGMGYFTENRSVYQQADDYTYTDENESASPLGDECSYFGQEMDVTSLVGSLQADESVLEPASEVESLAVDVPVKTTRKFVSAVNVKSVRVKKSLVESLRAKNNDEVTHSKENDTSRLQKDDIKNLQAKHNDEVVHLKEKDSSAPLIEDSYLGKGMDVTNLTISKGNEGVSRPDEGSNLGKTMNISSSQLTKEMEMNPTEKGMLISFRPDENSCIEKGLLGTSDQQDDEANPSFTNVNKSQRPDDAMGIKEKNLKNTEDMIMAVGTSFACREIDPWYEDGEYQDETMATKSIKAALMEDPITFRRKFMLLFLILGVATITGSIAAFVTSRHQASNSGGEWTIMPSPSPITSKPTAEPTDAPVTLAPTSRPTAGTATPTVDNADANIDTSSPSSANDNVYTTSPTSATFVPQTMSLRQWIELSSPESLLALNNATSPQTKALDWAIQQPNPSLVHFGLATLRYATNSSSGWRNDDGWLTSDVCEWYGIVCRGNIVVEVFLSFNNLGATLPDEVSLLTDLELLSISGSAENGETQGNLVGTIPSTWGKRLANLITLELYDNQLTGGIPSNLQYLTRLKTLDLEGNDLSGSLPTEFGKMTSLEILDLSNNDISGTIPTEVGRLSRLSRLALHDNELTGLLPTEIGSLQLLNEFEIQYNAFMGSLPTSMYSLSNLAWLDVSSNELGGVLSSSIGSLSNLKGLFVQDNQLSGPIPEQLAALSSLRSLNVSKNALTGSVISNLGSLTSLVELSLESNLLDGSVPNAICESLTLLRHFSYSSNCQTCPCCTECLN